jgi:uncharacterized cupin superfamily protein
MAKIDIGKTRRIERSGYPKPFDEPCNPRLRHVLGEAAGLDRFGVNLLRLAPGCWSSQRHWHTEEDEFVWVLSGEVVLVTDQGEEILRAGDCAGFKAGVANGHHLQNRSSVEAVLLEVGSRDPADKCAYPDIDLIWSEETGYAHQDGTTY